MTRITFLHGATDRLAAAGQWFQHDWDGRRRVSVHVVSEAVAERLDRLLWLQPAGGFLPHCRSDSPLAPETPIVIGPLAADSVAAGEVLLNLSDEIPPGFARFEEVVEIVSNDDATRLPARERYRFYRDRGYALDSHDVGEGKP